MAILYLLLGGGLLWLALFDGDFAVALYILFRRLVVAELQTRPQTRTARHSDHLMGRFRPQIGSAGSGYLSVRVTILRILRTPSPTSRATIGMLTAIATSGSTGAPIDSIPFVA